MADSLDVTTYGPQQSTSLFTVFKQVIKGFKEGVPLGIQLAVRDIKALYRQSVLGLGWAIFTPVAQTLVWLMLSSRGIITVGDTGVPYALFVLTGIMLWQSMLEALNAPLQMFNSAKAAMRKINFNKEALIIGGGLKVLFNFVIKLVVLLPMMFYYGIDLHASMLLAPIFILVMLFFTLFVGVLLTPIGALYTDVPRVIQALSQLVFLLTPIIYPPRLDGAFGLLDRVNPLSIAVGSARDTMLGQGFPDWTSYGLFFGAVLIIGFVATTLFRVSLPIIIERMGS